MIETFSSILGYALPFLFIFTLVVFIHELGHFLVARWNGVFVETFSIGMGKELFHRNDSYGTRWRIALFPIGGYCKMRGEQDGLIEEQLTKNASSQDASSQEYKSSCYDNKSVYERMAIASAGPVANFVLAIAIFWGIFFIFGVRQVSSEVSEVFKGSVAEAAGFQKGDLILSINDESVSAPGDVSRLVSLSVGERLAIRIEREGKQGVLFAVPRLGEVSNRMGGTYTTGAIGIGLIEKEIGRQHVGLFSSFGHSVGHFGKVIGVTFTYLGQLIIGKQDASNLSGPVRIIQIASKSAGEGFISLLALAAVLSISLGIMNLLPIPVLDGGHILFYIIEAIKGSPVSERAQQHAMRVGLVLIFALMLFVTLNDFIQLGLLGLD